MRLRFSLPFRLFLYRDLPNVYVRHDTSRHQWEFNDRVLSFEKCIVVDHINFYVTRITRKQLVP